MPEVIEKKRLPGRLPLCPESHRESIEEFLKYFYDRTEKALNDYILITRTDRSSSAIGQCEHFRKLKQSLEWLRAMNAARRKHAKRS